MVGIVKLINNHLLDNDRHVKTKHILLMHRLEQIPVKIGVNYELTLCNEALVRIIFFSNLQCILCAECSWGAVLRCICVARKHLKR